VVKQVLGTSALQFSTVGYYFNCLLFSLLFGARRREQIAIDAFLIEIQRGYQNASSIPIHIHTKNKNTLIASHTSVLKAQHVIWRAVWGDGEQRFSVSLG
jgi:hypothetical protein